MMNQLIHVVLMFILNGSKYYKMVFDICWVYPEVYKRWTTEDV
jgi:hypothetical protein